MPAYQGDKAGTGPAPKQPTGAAGGLPVPTPVGTLPNPAAGGYGAGPAPVGTLPNPAAGAPVGTLPNPAGGRMSASNSVQASPAMGGQGMPGSVPQVMFSVGSSHGLVRACPRARCAVSLV